MKKLIAIALASSLIPFAVNAASSVGQCVYPKNKVGKNGRLEFIKPIYLSSTPDGADQRQLTTFSAFTVKAEKNGYFQLVTVPDYDKPNPDKEAGKFIGWGKKSDFMFQELRNCN